MGFFQPLNIKATKHVSFKYQACIKKVSHPRVNLSTVDFSLFYYPSNMHLRGNMNPRLSYSHKLKPSGTKELPDN